MATNHYTATYLLESLKRRGMLPSTTEALSTADYLALADEELQTFVVPLLMSVREEYFVTTLDVSVASGTANYGIPARAIGGKVRFVQVNDGSGTYVPFRRIDAERAHEYVYSGDSPAGYRMEGGNLVIVPTPSATSTIRVSYFARPGRLVPTTEAAQITVINTGTRVVTLSATIPATFTTAELYDLVAGKPGFATLGIDLAVTAASGTSMTFTATLPTGLAVGDYVALAGESPIPQIPVEIMPLLAQRVAFKAQEALGDPRAAVAKAEADEMRNRLLGSLAPRDEASARYLSNPHAPGYGRRW